VKHLVALVFIVVVPLQDQSPAHARIRRVHSSFSGEPNKGLGVFRPQIKKRTASKYYFWGDKCSTYNVTDNDGFSVTLKKMKISLVLSFFEWSKEKTSY